VPDEEADANDLLEKIVVGMYYVCYFPGVIFFLIWFYRAYANLKALGAGKPRYSPGWAVGAWFIPLANLVWPCVIAQEIWRKSDPNLATGDADQAHRTGPRSGLIMAWWVLWVLSSLISNATFRATLHAETLPAIKTLTVAALVRDLLLIATAILVITVIARLERRQAARFAALRPAALGPPGAPGSVPSAAADDERFQPAPRFPRGPL
jgi:hypothetical protein